MLKQLLTGSALALVLAATPVAAQSDDAATKQPETQATEQAPDATTGTSGSMESATTAEGENLTTDESAETAQSDEAIEAESDTAQSDTMSTEEPAMAEGEMATDAGMEQASGELYIGQQAEGELLASDLIGSSVENPEGETLGDINDVIVGESEGIKAVVVGVGGFLGIGEKDVAVNFEEIEQTRDENGDLKLVLTTTKDDLENAPKFVSLEEQEEAQRQQAEAQQDQTMTGSGSMTGSGDTSNMGTSSETMGTTGTATEGQTQ